MGSKALPRYRRLTKSEADKQPAWSAVCPTNEALIAAIYLAGTNMRRVKRVLVSPFGGAVDKDVVSRVWRRVKVDLACGRH
jgi:Transposase, Mutator family.